MLEPLFVLDCSGKAADEQEDWREQRHLCDQIDTNQYFAAAFVQCVKASAIERGRK